MASTTLEAATVATLSFLKPGSWPSDQKPYEMLYTPADGIPLINHETAEVCGIPIHDLRPRKDELSLDEEGFIISELKSQHQYEDLQDEEFLKTVFAQELRDHLLKRLGARALYIHECVLRKRTDLPEYQRNGRGIPIPLAHTGLSSAQSNFSVLFNSSSLDYTLNYVKKLIEQLFGEDIAKQIGQMHFQMLNVWVPLQGPCRDWPLALCDVRSVKKGDIVPMDEVHANDVLESQQVIYRSSQRWHYLSNQQPYELLIFKAADWRKHGAVPHGSFLDPHYPNEECKRESIEFRVLVVY